MNVKEAMVVAKAYLTQYQQYMDPGFPGGITGVGLDADSPECYPYYLLVYTKDDALHNALPDKFMGMGVRFMVSQW